MRRQAGFSLVEVLIATALLTIVILATSSYLAKTNSDSKAQTLREMQRMLYNKLALSAQDPESLARSGTAPGFFKNCLDLTDGVLCITTDAATKRPFTLVAPDGTAIAGPTVLYSANGDTNCGPAGTGVPPCRFRADTTFWATCPLNPATLIPQGSCLEPIAVNVRLQIRPVGMPTIGNYPRDALFNNAAQPENYTFTTTVRDIKLAYTSPCPGNQIQTWNAAGTFRCLCPNGKVPTGAGACPDIRCRPTEIMIGMLPNGMPRCVVPTNNQLCWDLPDLRTNGDCGPGAWLVRIDYGVCQTGDASKGKSGSDEVTCDNDNGRCCMGTQ